MLFRSTQLGKALGIWLEDFGALVAAGGAVATADSAGAATAASAGTGAGGPGQVFAPLSSPLGEVTGTLLAEEIHLAGATELGSFVGGRRDGDPAFTVNSYGSGSAYYLATIPDAAGSALIVSHILAEAGVEPVLPGLPETVEAIRRGDVLTLINHGTDAVTVSLPAGELLASQGVELHAEGAVDVADVADVAGADGADGIQQAASVTLESFGSVILRTASAGGHGVGDMHRAPASR